jgi:hypothetical protein
MSLDSNLEPGAYILQLAVTEKLTEKKSVTEIQAIDFKFVRKRQLCKSFGWQWQRR